MAAMVLVGFVLSVVSGCSDTPTQKAPPPDKKEGEKRTGKPD
jgi:hypothetical protein